MKKLISLFLVVITIMSMSTVAFAADFDDVVDTHSNYEAIETLETLGIINGYEDGSYGPDKVLTRAECATMLTRAMYPVYYGNSETFTDVPVTHWARIYVDTAYRHGLMVGHGDGTFGPDDELTYTQFARVILNTLGYGTFEWPVGVNTVAYELGLYHNIPVVDFETGCTRAHAAQMLYNAFDMAIVRQYANHHFVTDKNFLNDVLGYKLTSKDVNGYIYTAYENLNTGKVYVTDICETYEATIYTNDGENYRVFGSYKAIDINWYWAADTKRPPVYLYVNGNKITMGSETKFQASGIATGVFNANGDLVSIQMVNTGKVYTPLSEVTILADETIPDYVRLDIAHNDLFNPNHSIVTYFYETETYIISNNVVYGFATGAGLNYIEVNGTSYTVSKIPYGYIKGAYVKLYIDYKGVVVDFEFISNPYVYNITDYTYHTINCPMYHFSFQQKWVTNEEDIDDKVTAENGIVFFKGCTTCGTQNPKWFRVPTGNEPVVYVTANSWTYYHDSTCTEVTKPENANTELIYIKDIATCGKQPHTCCKGSN